MKIYMYFFATLLLLACKEEKEEPLYFETTAPTAYTFPETEASATFTISGNTAWSIKVTEGHDLCSVMPASGKGDATVAVRVTANSAYLQERSMSFVLAAGDYTKEVAISQAAPPCPDFSPGAIATAGQTVTIGGTPATINSTQPATGGDGQISYQWYKNGNLINGATGAAYTPPTEDAATVSVITYTRRAKDNTCNTTLTPSAGSWVLTVTCPSFSPGTIATAGQTITIGGTPITIHSVQNATSESGSVSYQWYRNGNAISGATAASYTPPQSAATAAGAHTYTRSAKDNVCNTTFTPSAGSWVLTVTCPSFNPGAIATAGQTITIGGTPITINSVQDATGSGMISYQWYKNDIAITGATSASYTPLPADAATLGAYTYTRRAKDNTCSTTLTASEGSWVLKIICGFDPGAIDNSGQTIVVGGTPATIHSTQDATGEGISYQWYKNGTVINGATSTSYTPLPADASAIGSTTYTRRARNSTCNTTLTPSAGSWVLTVVSCIFNAGAIATDGQTICSGGAVNTIISNADASGGNGNITYQWRRNGSAISGSAATYTPTAYNTTIGTHTFTRWARDGTCQTSWLQSAGSWTLLVMANAQLTLTTANSTQYVANGATIDPIKYTTANASTISVVGLPDGITYDWTNNTLTISGSSTLTGTHSFAVTATGAGGCGNTYASGSILIYPVGVDGYGCVESNLTLGTVGFASTVTHVISGVYGSQTWSAPVVATYCDKTSYQGSEANGYKADCRKNPDKPSGHYFSWCLVSQYSEQLCPSPWRAPTRDDFCLLDKLVRDVSVCSNSNLDALFVELWGGTYGGYYNSGGHIIYLGTTAFYWSPLAFDDKAGVAFAYASGSVYPQYYQEKHYGIQVRCVKD
jgi:uncharacterized protein (TIGR02145 family)